MSRTVVALAALMLAGPPVQAVAREIPALSGPVVDEAGMLGGRDRERLTALSRGAWALPVEQRVQLQYLLVPSLDGEDLEGFAVRVFEAWKLGDKGRDNGVLVVVARDDRKIRIEVGYGAEGALTDAQSGRIIRDTLAPAFREGRHGDGLYRAGVWILTILGAMPPEVVSQGAGDPGPVITGKAVGGPGREMATDGLVQRGRRPTPPWLIVVIAVWLPGMLLFIFLFGCAIFQGIRDIIRGIRKMIHGEWPWAVPDPRVAAGGASPGTAAGAAAVAVAAAAAGAGAVGARVEAAPRAAGDGYDTVGVGSVKKAG